jgi:hypothetical protein
MKLCPLFESIELPELIQPGNVPMTPHNVMLATVGLCNDALPRDAIEAAIHALEFAEFLPHSEAVNEKYIEQLRAMLPEEGK